MFENEAMQARDPSGDWDHKDASTGTTGSSRVYFSICFLLIHRVFRTFLTSLLGFKATKTRSFPIKTRVKQVLGTRSIKRTIWFLLG